MFKKMLPWVIMIFVVITLIVASAFLLWDKLFSDPAADVNTEAQNSVDKVEGEKLSAQEIKDLSFEIADVLTNLSTGDFVKVSITFVMSNENARHEIELLDFKVRHLINNTLADLNPEDVRGSKGYDTISASLMNKINQVLDEGKVREVNITSFVIS